MSNELITSQNIIFVLGILAIIFSVYHYFKNPQIDSEKKDAILAQKVQWTNEANERRFSELQQNIKDAFLLASNHTNTVDTKVDKLIESVNRAEISIVRLATVIEERIPKK